MTSDGRTDDDGLTPAESLALVQQQTAHVRKGTDVRVELLYGAWGLAWLIGFAAMWAARSDSSPLRPPVLVAGLVLAAVMVAAVVVTVGHTARQTRGVLSSDALRGALYGWTWPVSFAGLTAVLVTLARRGADPALLEVLWPAGSCLLVAALYMMGSAVWRDPHMFALGAWFAVCVVAGVLVGVPGMFAVMSLAGGGGFLAAATYFVLRSRGDA
ncbi:hypothetical protein [Angustibacter speluncae]